MARQRVHPRGRTDDAIADRVESHRQAGITTLLAKLDGDYAHQLSTLERLMGIVTA